MSRQPLYATITDKHCERTSSSRRGRIDWIRFWLNSEFDEVMMVSSDSTGELTKLDEDQAVMKMKEWDKIGNKKKVDEWKQKLLERSKCNAELEARERVNVHITLKENEKFNFFINNVSLDNTTSPVISYHLNQIEAIYKAENKVFPKKEMIALLTAEEV